VSLHASGIAVILGVPGWLEAILWVFLAGTLIKLALDKRKRRRSDTL
jgi:hypothetical protein